MVEKLKEKLWAFIVHNNPDLMLNLQEEYSVTKYLEEKVNGIIPMIEALLAEGKPQYVIEELCLSAMTAELKPSKFLYIRSVIEEEFPDDFKRLQEDGVLTYEVVNLIEACQDAFEAFGFSEETQDDRHLRYAIIAQVHDYLL
ncbi:hypothetical protein [Mucilaginibacter polytrichastri]|uniref:DUF1896 domain-containing protein n=1 Tax=Mucilaginibacter polytrichastri TaxID=1302689 RepID=A0A1Q5ZV85_9SPHI|nr:hypothetical protein [Mucilaginibacter polytrichastri]OKS85692.1 hypothetical protein RG47T_1138 [Mucilaginibacter polytrichastri]SFS62007.1 hypothetical protein SAMN04487890_102439 [Mucilaginibacter polytrichastri]